MNIMRLFCIMAQSLFYRSSIYESEVSLTPFGTRIKQTSASSSSPKHHTTSLMLMSRSRSLIPCSTIMCCLELVSEQHSLKVRLSLAQGPLYMLYFVVGLLCMMSVELYTFSRLVKKHHVKLIWGRFFFSSPWSDLFLTTFNSATYFLVVQWYLPVIFTVP